MSRFENYFRKIVLILMRVCRQIMFLYPDYMIVNWVKKLCRFFCIVIRGGSYIILIYF